MPIEIVEKFKSRRGRRSVTGENDYDELLYDIYGSDDTVAMRTALLDDQNGGAPLTFDGLPRTEVEILDQVGSEHWEASASYGIIRAGETLLNVGESSFSFETGGGTTHITQSLETIAKYPATAPASGGAINDTGENIEGADIVIPIYTFSETHVLANSTVNGAYKSTLFGLTGRTNNASFRGFDAGEVLFLGASGTKRGDDNWEVTFRFAASPNLSGATIGGITGINKAGWDYLWMRYEKQVNGSGENAKGMHIPVAAYVDRVYEAGAFSGLGIGTS